MRELLSKLVAGGLSAAVILLWWPRFFPADTATTWLVRGVVWTLSFELLLHALLPVERALWDTRAGEKVRAGASKARTGSLRGRAVIACGALTVPVALLAFAPAPPVKRVAVAPVRHVTEVKRIVKVEHKQVRVPVAVPAPAPAVAVTPEPPAAAAPPRVVRRTTARPDRTTSTSKQPSAGGDATAAPEQTAQQQPVSAPRLVRRAGPA